MNDRPSKLFALLLAAGMVLGAVGAAYGVRVLGEVLGVLVGWTS